mgnify:CR=1 FL=1
MSLIHSSCRICLTTDEDKVFKTFKKGSQLYLKILTVYKLNAVANRSYSLICPNCEKDVIAAFNVYNRIRDANEFFNHQNKLMKVTEPAKKKVTFSVSSTIFECGRCSDAFKSMEELNKHLTKHYGKFCLSLNFLS